MLQEILKEVIPVLIQISGLLLLLAGLWVFKYLKDKVKVTVIHEALNIVKEVILNVITSSTKELKTKYKEAMKDGKITEEEKEELKQIVLNKTKKEVPNAIKKLVGLTEEEFEEFIGDYFEEVLESDIKKYLEE